MKSGSHLEQVLSSRLFAVTAEIGPPKSADGEVIRRKARLLRDLVDAANVTDNQTAVVRLSSIAGGYIAQQEGLEPIVQMTCRDRNRIMLQSDVLGLSALGLKNILSMGGDPPTIGNHPDAKPVFDLDANGLVRLLRDMRDEKKFLNGEPIEVEPRVFIGAAANPFGGPAETGAQILENKVNLGADFVQTQLVYNVERFAEWMAAVRARGLHQRVYILAGVGPLKSAGAAKYMRDNIPGMDVPESVIQRMERAGKGEPARAEGLNVCVEIIQQVRQIEGVAGVHIMAIEWEDAIPEICRRAGLLPRPTAEAVQPLNAS